jgi:diadenosine tetraphosphatase ApaH/serine/threonine PP2A family protein phosphatase
MDAIITDIHGNLEALLAVLDATHDMQARRIICLGDLVCYGPDSVACVRRSANFDVTILGDWDARIFEHNDEEWHPVLEHHIEYVRSEFDNAADCESLYSTLRSYGDSYIESGVHFVHGTPHGRREHVFPEAVYDTRKLNRIADSFELATICGHVHMNGIYRRHANFEWEYVHPEPGIRYDLASANKTIVTVGSVGQPRDEDPRAAFATIDENVVTFHRVEYDIATTIEKIRSNSQLDDMFGERLKYGR